MSKAFETAVRFLAARDHSRFELENKLLNKGFSDEETNAAIKKCQHLNLQSDQRFVEMAGQARIRQGYGPLRIRQELQFKRVDPDLINDFLRAHESDWLEHARKVWQKKFKIQKTFSPAELQKQQRFLQYRGFSTHIIAKLLQNHK